MSDSVVDTQEKFLAAYVSLEALRHSAPGATYKRARSGQQAEVFFLPKYKIEQEAVQSLVQSCDFSTHRVVAWIDASKEEQSAQLSCFIASIASLEVMAKALPLQPKDEALTQAIVEFEQYRSKAIGDAEQLLHDAELINRSQPSSENFYILCQAEKSLTELKEGLAQEFKTMHQHHELARSVRAGQIELGWMPEPDQTEKRIILSAVDNVRNQLEDLYRRQA